jgi:hypothetical protein
MLSNYLAEVWGISIVVVCLALLIKDGHLKKFYASLETEDNFFLWGFISLVIGIGMVLAYNVWTWNWQIIITLLGWTALAKGLFLLFVPETIKTFVKKINYQRWMPFWLMIMLFLGLAITYLGFTA